MDTIILFLSGASWLCYASATEQVQLSKAGLGSPLVPSPPAPSSGGSECAAPLVRFLLLQIGGASSVWSWPAAASSAGSANPGMSDTDPRETLAVCPRGTVNESLSAGEEAFALAEAHVGLLRALLTTEGWSGPLADCVREVGEIFRRIWL